MIVEFGSYDRKVCRPLSYADMPAYIGFQDSLSTTQQDIKSLLQGDGTYEAWTHDWHVIRSNVLTTVLRDSPPVYEYILPNITLQEQLDILFD